MVENKSLWLDTLRRHRKAHALKGALDADVLVVGGGIAGASALYHLLSGTDKSVILVDSHLVGHGATGHNAGQLYGGFEEHISERIDAFGLEKALEGERIVEDGWGMLDEMHKKVGSQAKKELFLAYGAYSDVDLIISNIEAYCHYLDLAGVPYEQFLVAEGTGVYESIPYTFRKYARLVPHDEVLDLLETKDRRYVAALPLRSGTLNSAQFAEDVVSYCLSRFSDRCKVFERSPVEEIVLSGSDVRAQGPGFLIRSTEAVLCINGFSRFKIVNAAGADIDSGLRQAVHGIVNYMGAYDTNSGRAPMIHWYHEPGQGSSLAGSKEDLYFYFSRRPAQDGLPKHICVGGPERAVSRHESYDRNSPIPDEAVAEMDAFLDRTLSAGEKVKPRQYWHGLLGYTPHGVRLIGREPRNRRLLYNLGCNGIGILHSVVGGKMVTEHIRGDSMPRTIFDPR